ncbi:MAG: translocation/assembly module TamB domain-containing protein [bacterium]
MKKLLKIVSISVAFLLVLVLVAVWLLTSSQGENLVKGWLENQLTAEIGLPVSIGRFETNLWSRIQIETLTVSTATDTQNQPILYVGQIRIGYSIFQLLGKIVTLETLSVDSVALEMALDSLGRFGVPLLDNPAEVTGDSSEKTGIVCIETVSLNRMSLFYFDPQVPLSVELAGAVLSAQGNRDGAFSGRLTAGNILAVYDSLALNFDTLEIGASLNSEMFRLEYAKADCEGLHMEAFGDLGTADSMNIALTVSVDGSLDTLASAFSATVELPSLRAGHMSAQCQIEGTVDDPNIRLDAILQDLILQDVAIQSAMLAAQYHDDLLLVDTFQVTTLKGAIDGKFRMMLDTLGSASLNLALNRIDLSSLWRVTYSEASPYQGTLNGKINAQGQGDDLTSWTVEALVAGDNLRYLNRPVPDLKCIVVSNAGKTSLSLIHGADEIHADIEFGEDSLQGVFNISVPDMTALSRFIDQPNLSGGLWAHGTIHGAYANPVFRSTVNGSRISYRDFPVDSIFAELSYADSSLTVIDFACEGKLDSIDSQRPPFGLDSIAGSVAYACRLRGSLDSLSGDFLAHLDKPRYHSYAIDSLSIKAALNGSQFGITELVASHEESDVLLTVTYDTSTASGSFDILLRPQSVPSDSRRELAHDSMKVRDNFGSVSGEFAFRSPSDVSATVHGQGLWLGLLAMFTEDTTLSDGEIEFDLAVDGPFLTPTAVLSTTARSVIISEYQIDSTSMHLRVAQDALTLDSLITYALGHTLRASGRLELGISPNGLFEMRDSASITAELSTADFDLSLLQSLILPEGEISGIVSSSVSLSGTIAAPRIEGWLVARNGTILLEEGSLPLENVGLSILFADSTFTIDSATGTVSNIAIRASGLLTTETFESASVDLDVSVGERGKLAIDGMVSDTGVQLQLLSDSFNLAVFQPFITELDSLAGRLGCRLLIVGQPATPQIDGSLRISALSFQAPKHYTTVSDGYADVRFDRNQVILDSARCSMNGGRVTASGVIEHDQGELIDIGLTLHANKMTLQEPGTYIIAVDSAVLSYRKRQGNYILDGDIVLGEARLTAGLRPTSILPWVQSLETVDLELPDLIARSRVDVRIRESDDLWVDNNLARIRLRAELGVIGTPLRPNFTGMIQVEEGYLLYLDRRFRVNEGSVYFNDPARFNPNINLDARTEVTVYRRTAAEPYTVFIKAEGLLDQLQYGLYSEPPLEKPDIVALLTLGATRTELAGGDNNDKGGFTGVLRDRASSLTSQRVSGYLSRKAGSFFGFDEFTIQGNLFQFNETWGPQLVASKRLSQRADLTYSTTVGYLNDQAVRLGYRLTSRFSLQGETDRQGRAGLDLKYGVTFK